MQAWPRESLPIWLHNASAHLHWHDATDIPYTLATDQRHDQTTYLMSLRSGWFDYAAQELQSRSVMAWGVRQIGQLTRMMGLDRLVLVNNLPVSTQIHQSHRFQAIAHTCDALTQALPEHFVAIRNLLPHQHQDLIAKLKDQNFVALPARVIYEFDLREPPKTKHSHLARDKSLFKKSGLQAMITRELSAAQSSRLRQLYQQIYIEKHSQLNPQYTAQFFNDMINLQIMPCLQIRDAQSQIQAFALLYRVGDTLTVPALGYDTEHAQTGLYRVLFAAIHDYAQAHQLLLNYSSGAGDFKRKRGAVAFLEYTLVRAPLRHRFGQHKWLQWAQSRTSTICANDLIALGA